MNNPAVITGLDLITPAGENSETTYASINAGINFIEFSDEFLDLKGESIRLAHISLKNEKEKRSEIFVNYLSDKFASFIQKKFSARKKQEKINLILSSGIDLNDFVFTEKIEHLCENIETLHIKSSNSSTIECFKKACEILEKDPEGLCITISIDSLINENTLENLEKEKRLATEGNGGYQKLVPSEGAAFFIVEKVKKAKNLNQNIYCAIEKTATATEPFPLLSDKPSKGEGLTKAFTAIFEKKPELKKEISDIFSDLNGEYYKSKEWGFVENRLFENNQKFKLWHPADCIGDSGGAFSGILAGIACEHIKKKENTNKVLIFSSGASGDCGVLILSKL